MRERLFNAAVGKKGVGKTYQNIQLVIKYVKGNLAAGVKPGRVLVFDTNDEYDNEFVTIKPISLNNVAAFAAHPIIEARRIRPFHTEGPLKGKKFGIDDLQNALGIVLDNYRNGLLIIEDLNRFTSDTMKQDLVGAICTNRHMGVDIVTSFQGIGAIVPKIWRNLSYMRMHKIREDVNAYASKYPDKIIFFAIAQNIVNKKYAEGDERFFVNIDLDKGVIAGKYTKEDFMNGARDYIYENYSKIISPLLKRKKMQGGEQEFNEATAFDSVMKQYVNEFSQYKETKNRT